MKPSPFPVDVVAMPGGDVLLLPAVWPVRLDREQQIQLGERLLRGDGPADATRA